MIRVHSRLYISLILSLGARITFPFSNDILQLILDEKPMIVFAGMEPPEQGETTRHSNCPELYLMAVTLPLFRTLSKYPLQRADAPSLYL